MSPKDFRALKDEISKDQFSESSSTGFIVDSIRPSSLQARFIQRKIFKEIFFDPFGNQKEIERTEYQQISFRLLPSSPHLEIINPPRNLNLLINRLGELTGGKAAIYPPEIEIKKWLNALSLKASTCKITGLLISNLQLSSTSVAKILLRGTEDVQGQLSSLVGKKPHTIKEAQVEIEIGNEVPQKLTIKENSRLTVSSPTEPETNLLREMVAELIGF
jgi:hypothetical protein